MLFVAQREEGIGTARGNVSGERGTSLENVQLEDAVAKADFSAG